MRFRLTVLQVLSTLLGLLGLAAGATAIWATHTYQPQMERQLGEAATQVGTAQTTLDTLFSDVEALLALAPEVENASRRTGLLLESSRTILDGFHGALAELAPALGSMATDLRSLAGTLGAMARGSNLRGTADQLERAGTQLATVLPPLAHLGTEFDETRQVVLAFSQQLTLTGDRLQADLEGLRAATGSVERAQSALRSDALPRAATGLGYGLGGLLLFFGLSLLVLARTQAALARSLAKNQVKPS